jgi:hypothetical protein
MISGEKRQAVKIAIEPLVLAHDVARGFQQSPWDSAVVGCAGVVLSIGYE